MRRNVYYIFGMLVLIPAEKHSEVSTFQHIGLQLLFLCPIILEVYKCQGSMHGTMFHHRLKLSFGAIMFFIKMSSLEFHYYY